MAAQRKIHLPDVILVKGAEAGGAAVLTVVATLIAWPILREGCSENSIIPHNLATCRDLSIALKSMDRAEAQCQLAQLLCSCCAELIRIHNISAEDPLSLLILNLFIPRKLGNHLSNRVSLAAEVLLRPDAEVHLLHDVGNGRDKKILLQMLNLSRKNHKLRLNGPRKRSLRLDNTDTLLAVVL